MSISAMQENEFSLPEDLWITRTVLKCGHIHAKETTQKRQGEEYESNPGESPHACP